MKDKYQAHFFGFVWVLSLSLFDIKKNVKISYVYILVKRALEKLHLHPQWGPNTHDDPHETGAARTAARPLLVQKNHFRNYQKSLNF